MKRLLTLLLLLCCAGIAHATVPVVPFTVTYTCTGGFGPFAFNFPISAANTLTATLNGVLLASTSYTTIPVNNNYNNGGNVTLGGSFPCTAGQKLVLTRVTPIAQSVQFYDNMPALPIITGNSVDKLTEIAQELNGLVGQIISGGLSITASAPLVATPNPIVGVGVISCPTCGTGTGTVSTTGSPASPELSCFSGSITITNCNLSGDATTTNTAAVTLATVNSGPGACGDATHVCQVTTNGKGLTTAQTQVAITGIPASAVPFSGITSSTNTTAAMVVGAGATLDFLSTGIIDANEVGGAVIPTSATVTATNSSKQIIAATVQGNGAKVQLSTGTTTTNDCVKFDANGNTVDSGGGCATSSLAFSGLTSGTNTTAAMVVGSGATLAPTSATAGVISANQINGTALAGLATGITRNTTTTGAVTSAELSGDATTSGSNAVTLATVNANVGSFTAANITVNAKGLVTAAANGSAGSSAPTFPVNAQTATYTATTTDFANCKAIPVTSGTFTVTLVAVGSQPATGQCIWVINYGTGLVQVAPNGQNLNGGSGNLKLQSGHSAIVISDGSNYETADIEGSKIGDTNAYFGPQIFPNGSSNNNTLIGSGAGGSNASLGNNNTFIGSSSGSSVGGPAAGDTFVGSNAGTGIFAAANDTYIGYQAGMADGGNNSTIIGYQVASSTGASDGNVFIGTSNGVECYTSSCSNYLNVQNLIYGDTSKGIIGFRGTTTTIAANACGSTTQGTLKSGSNDMSGEVTVGTATVTSCAVTFANTHSVAPNCIVSSQVSGTVVGLGYTASTTALTVTATSGFTSTVFDYFCPAAATSTNPTP